jgi:hypothetical protein
MVAIVDSGISILIPHYIVHVRIVRYMAGIVKGKGWVQQHSKSIRSNMEERLTRGQLIVIATCHQFAILHAGCWQNIKMSR